MEPDSVDASHAEREQGDDRAHVPVLALTVDALNVVAPVHRAGVRREPACGQGADIKDPPLLKLIHDTLEPAVLITFDHKMQVEHRGLLDKYGTTLAVVDKRAEPPEMTREEYWREVIHRHAHRIVNQTAGTLFAISVVAADAFRRGKPDSKVR
jgi:hypothetical protein